MYVLLCKYFQQPANPPNNDSKLSENDAKLNKNGTNLNKNGNPEKWHYSPTKTVQNVPWQPVIREKRYSGSTLKHGEAHCDHEEQHETQPMAVGTFR